MQAIKLLSRAIVYGKKKARLHSRMKSTDHLAARFLKAIEPRIEHMLITLDVDLVQDRNNSCTRCQRVRDLVQGRTDTCYTPAPLEIDPGSNLI